MNEKQANERYTSASIVPMLDDIYDFITWGAFAKHFFPDHSVTWFYNKMRGVDGNGGLGGFTDEERKQLKQSLQKLASSISETAAQL